jgi:hypothetical protein
MVTNDGFKEFIRPETTVTDREEWSETVEQTKTHPRL